MDELQIEVMIPGEPGEVTAVGDTLTVHYTGQLEDGTIFDSSIDRGEPFRFAIGSGMVIQGWEEGMLGMHVGETRKLVIPYHMGYGEDGFGPIPPKATLIFEVTLLDIS